MSTALLCGSLIDGVSAEPRRNMAVLIERSRIVSVLPSDRLTLQGHSVVELPGTMMPGLVDAHAHLALDVGDLEAQCADPVESQLVKGIATGAEMLRTGVTTLRDCGEVGHIGPALRRLEREGLTASPRLTVSGRPIARPRGHAWYLGREAEGDAELRQAVRDEIDRGADFIKVMATGGVTTPGTDVRGQEFDDASLETIVAEARHRGRTVAAHAHGGPAVSGAVRAGVRSIEHGLFLGEQEIDEMARAGTWLVVTVGLFEEMIARGKVSAAQQQPLLDALRGHRDVLEYARSRGLKVAAGTDENHGRLDAEVKFLRSAGYSPMSALHAVTRWASELAMCPDVGTVEPGKFADLICVDGDPIEDVSALRRTTTVIKGGVIVSGEGSIGGQDVAA